MKTILTTAVAMAMTVTAMAAEDTNIWSLDSCIAYACRNNINVRQAKIDAQTAVYGVTEAKDRFLPTMSAGVHQGFDFGRGLTSQNTYANRNTSNFAWNVGISAPLFQGLSAVRNLDYQKARLSAVLEQVEVAKDDITLNIISAYLQALYCDEMVNVAREQYKKSEDELARRITLAQDGKIAEIDVTQARSQLANDNLTLLNAVNDKSLALLSLSQMMQLPQADGFDICPLGDAPIVIAAPDDVYANALAHNHTVKSARLNEAAAMRNIALARTGYIPTLSLNLGMGSSYYNINGMSNSAFGSQMRDNFAKSISFSLSIPIFDAFATRNSERRARAAFASAQLQTEDARTRLYHAIETAYFQAVTAKSRIAASQVARDAAAEAFVAMQSKYDLGRATPTEYEQSKVALYVAEASLVQSRYEAMLRARILDFYNTAPVY